MENIYLEVKGFDKEAGEKYSRIQTALYTMSAVYCGRGYHGGRNPDGYGKAP